MGTGLKAVSYTHLGIIGAKYFIPWTLLVLVCSFALQIVFIVEFGFTMASQYSAFLQNVVMSILFIQLFVKRNGDFGQSLLLAVAKWIGTLAPTILMGVITVSYTHLDRIARRNRSTGGDCGACGTGSRPSGDTVQLAGN